MKCNLDRLKGFLRLLTRSVYDINDYIYTYYNALAAPTVKYLSTAGT